ncbi:MAG: Ig-like domain-containing protein [Prevotella sp.]
MRKILHITLMGIMMLVCGTAYADAYKTLSFPDDNKENNKLGAYTETWTAQIGSDTWTIANFNNNKWDNWTYIRCGRKSNESVASISTDFAIDKAIDNVCVTIDKVSNTNKINSIKLLVASDKDFNNVVETVNADIASLAAGNLIFNVTTPASNKYYKLVFDMQIAGANGIIQISKVQYNEAGAVILEPAQLSFNRVTCSATIGQEVEYPTLNNPNNLAVTYDSSDKSVATVAADGTVTILAAGETTISASSAKTDKFDAGYAYYVLTVKAASAVDIANTPETAYTVEKALQLIEAGEGLESKVYVKGKITNIEEVSTQYGNATYTLSDEGKDNALLVYRGYYLNGDRFTAEDQIKLNDIVVVYGKLVDYKGTKEFTTGSSIYSVNGTTGINTIETATEKNAPAYNIAGQRTSGTYKGIVIKGGKKFVNK